MASLFNFSYDVAMHGQHVCYLALNLTRRSSALDRQHQFAVRDSCHQDWSVVKVLSDVDSGELKGGSRAEQH